MIVYKVVGKGTRHCSNWCMYENKSKLTRKKFLRKYPEMQQYLPRYLKGTIINSVPDSPGIMTFISIDAAWNFKTVNRNSLDRTIIIKVRGIHAKITSMILSSAGSYPERLCSYNNSKYDYRQPPLGTKFFESVEVLE